jgi:hypothetical protein
MSESSIEWTNRTWNPTTGCTKFSKECDNCYAEKESNRYMHNPKQPKYKLGFDTVVEHKDSLFDPFTWNKPQTVFVNSMSDLFQKDVSLKFIQQVFKVMNDTPQHTYQVLTKRDNIGAINRSMIALGQYSNINYAKDILATLLFQNKNNIVQQYKNQINSKVVYDSVLSKNPENLDLAPFEAVLRFFVEFSNPTSISYSWNRSLPNSLDMFAGGKTAFYLGRASDLFSIESINPNLSYDVTQIPQIKDSQTRRTYGEIHAFVVNKKSSNITAALKLIQMLSQADNAKSISVAISLPPVLRTLLKDKPVDPYLYTFFDSAVISKTWFDPDRKQSDIIFEELIENILSNKLSISEAITKVEGQLELLLKYK